MSTASASSPKFRKVLPSVAKTSVPASRIRAAVKSVSATTATRKVAGKSRQGSAASR